MDFIIKWLASLFEAFKLKNPVVAGVLVLILSAVVHTATQGTLLGLFQLPDWAAAALEYVGLFLLAVTGSQTFRYLPASKQATARK